MRNLRGRVAVVTGAANGLGRALALELANRGCSIAAADVDGPGLARLAAEMPPETRVTTHVVDVSSAAQMEQFASDVVAAHGSVQILLNNAGVALVGKLHETSLADLEWILGVNVWGVIHGCRNFLPFLLREPQAQIVNVSSIFGLMSIGKQTSYCLSKHAVRGFSDALRAELSDTGVRVLVVYPVGLRTRSPASARHSGAVDAHAEQRVQSWFAEKAMPAEKAARKIVRAIEGGVSRLVIGPETRVADIAVRLFPTAFHYVFEVIRARWSRVRA
ncbi:MAG TPA: SDR family NAD(P)-dependent oxidoreductase [Thermoanaerobaculia bacterium]|nr:SDR family NAD(P)-dependent oxidoreductase [Thermoanaerobaculia bacterium]